MCDYLNCNFFDINNPYLGTFYAVTSGICFGISNSLLKIAVDHANPFQIAFYYAIFSVILLAPYFLVTHQAPILVTGEKICAAFISFLQATNIFLVIVSLYFISVFSANVILNISPMISAIVTCVVHEEAIDYREMILLSVASLGCVLISTSNFITGDDENNPLYQLFGSLIIFVASVIFGTLSVLIKNVQATKESTIIFYTFFTIICSSFLIGISLNDINLEISGEELGLIFSVAVLSLLYLFLQFKALYIQSSVKSTLQFCFDLPLVFILQWVFWNKLPSYIEFVGISFIVSAIIFLALKERLLSLFSNMDCLPHSDDPEEEKIIQ